MGLPVLASVEGPSAQQRLRPAQDGQQVFQGGSEAHVPPRRPNIVFILTDDQDLHMNSLDYLPQIKKHLIDHGTLYKKHFCTTAICCPSRVSILTGKLSHNTNVTDVFPPYGKPTYSSFRFRGSGHDLTSQVATPNLSQEATTRITYLYGYRMQVTTPTTRASFSMPIMSTITILHS